MGSCQKFCIDHKHFEINKENTRWWRIAESSRSVTKFISIDVDALEWLSSFKGVCKASSGSSEF